MLCRTAFDCSGRFKYIRYCGPWRPLGAAKGPPRSKMLLLLMPLMPLMPLQLLKLLMLLIH